MSSSVHVGAGRKGSSSEKVDSEKAKYSGKRIKHSKKAKYSRKKDKAQSKTEAQWEQYNKETRHDVDYGRSLHVHTFSNATAGIQSLILREDASHANHAHHWNKGCMPAMNPAY